MIDTIYKDIEAALRALDSSLQAHPLGKIRFISPWLGEYDKGDQPAVFVEIANIKWEDNNSLGQSGLALIRLHVVMKSYAKGDEKSRDQAKFLNLYEYPSLINKGIQGKSGQVFTGLLRRSDDTDVSPDGLYIHVIAYETTVQDLSVSRKNNKYVFTQPDTGDLEISVT